MRRRRYFPMVRAKCRRILGSGAEADEVAQDTFVRLWQEGPVQGAPHTVTAWIYRTATHLAIDRVRQRTRARRLAPEPPAPSPHPGDAALALDRLADRVPQTQLAAVLLHRVDGLSQRETAEVLGLTDRHVRRLIAAFDAADEP
ncbi:MAG: RNA polymerase sigma factor [Myxococcota bacterium]